MLGARFLVAGLVMLVLLWARGVPLPRGMQSRSATIVGALLLVGGNGALGWAVQTVPSGLAALTVAVVPVWMVLFDWLAGGPRPSRGIVAGLLVGFAGVGVLIGPEAILGEGAVHPLAAMVLNLGAMAWAIGSIYSRSAPMPRSPLMATAAQMICGGIGLLILGMAAGEIAGFDPTTVTSRALLAWAYLVVFGAIIAFTAYVYMLRVTTPAKASTYAYVNPVIAVLLGWALAGEPLNGRVLGAMLLIVPAVALIMSLSNRPVSGSSAADAPAGSSAEASAR